LTEQVDGHVERSRAGDDGLSVDNVGINIPTGVVNVAEFIGGNVARVLAQIIGEGTGSGLIELVNTTTVISSAGSGVRLNVLQVTSDEATDYRYEKRQNLNVTLLFSIVLKSLISANLP